MGDRLEQALACYSCAERELEEARWELIAAFNESSAAKDPRRLIGAGAHRAVAAEPDPERGRETPTAAARSGGF